MSEKKMNARILHKHDTEENWNKATGFIPKEGELIIYDVDEGHSKPRFKVGDGKTVVKDLPFAVLDNIQDENGVITIGSVWTKPIDEYDIPEELPREVMFESTDFKITTQHEASKRTILNYNDTDDETIDDTAELTLGTTENKIYVHLEGEAVDVKVPVAGFPSTSCTPLQIHGDSENLIGVVEVEGKLFYNNKEVATKADIESKADKATTLEGYGITDGATKTELDSKLPKTGTVDYINVDLTNGDDRVGTILSAYSFFGDTSVTIGAQGGGTGSFVPTITTLAGTTVQITSGTGEEILGEYYNNTLAINVFAKNEEDSSITAVTEVYGELFYNDKEVATKDDLEGIDTTPYEYITEDTASKSLIISADKIKTGNNTVTGSGSVAFGSGNTVSGDAAFAAGAETQAADHYSHAEGYQTKALKGYSHAEGTGSEASNTAAHAEGKNTVASGLHSHAEGYHTTASGGNAHAEGGRTVASGDNSHAEGERTVANGNYSHAEGNYTEVYGDRSHIEGFSSAKASSVVSGLSQSTSEDTIKSAWANNKFALVLGNNAHGEGKDNLVLGAFSHAEGRNTIAGSDANSAWYAHAEGKDTKALGNASHAEGLKTEATGQVSHAEGSQTIASGDWSHAEGALTEAQGDYSHASGTGTIAKEMAQFVCGAYNAEDSDALLIVGAAQSDLSRTNCFSTGRYSDGKSYIKIGNAQLTANESKVLYNNSELATKTDLSSLGGGTITSVNGQTGPEVTLTASDVGAVAIHNEGNMAITGKDAYSGLDNNILTFTDNSEVFAGHAYDITLGGVSTLESSCNVGVSIEGTNINICPASFVENTHYETVPAISITAQTEYSDTENKEIPKPITNIKGELYYNNKEVATKEDITNATGGNVTSVNGKTGAVTLEAEDVGAYTTAQVDSLIAEIDTESNLPIEYEGSTVNITAPLNVLSSLEVGTISDAEYSNSSAMGYKVSVLADEAHAQGRSSNQAYGREGILPSGLSNWEIISEWQSRKFLVAGGVASHAEGTDTLALGDSSHAEGKETIAEGDYSHTEGRGTVAGSNELDEEGNAIAWFAHAEGVDTKALGRASHAEGDNTIANGRSSHAEGENNTTYGKYSHIEGGANTITETGDYAHVEGGGNSASGKAAHVEGGNNSASGDASHAEGHYTQAIGDASHASGYYTIAKEDAQFVCGAGNADEKSAMFIVGGSDDPDDRNNCFSTGRELVNGERSKDGEAYIKVGNTQITETQLIKILKFIESIQEIGGTN